MPPGLVSSDRATDIATSDTSSFCELVQNNTQRLLVHLTLLSHWPVTTSHFFFGLLRLGRP